MAERADYRRWNISRLVMTAWRNFRQETSLTLRGRTFFVGPNASGKSNILDALRFIRDVAAMGLNDAVSVRGGMRDVRSLHARQFRGVRIAVDAGPRDGTRWSYDLHFRNHPQSHRPVVEHERVSLNDEPILERPDEKDTGDPERLTQTHLEQVSENQRFRPLAAFFGSIRYLHLVPQIVRERRRNGDFRGDPYGSDLLEQIAETTRRTRDARLRRIQEALRVAVPHFDRFELDRDLRGDWHLNATYNPAALLDDRGIDLQEIFLLTPGSEGTTISRASEIEDVRRLVEQDFTPGEAIMPRAAPESAHQFTHSTGRW